MPTTVTFDDLTGLDAVVEQLKARVTVWYDHEVSDRYGFARRGGVLLLGPPGAGKTKLAYAMRNYATELAGVEVAGFETSLEDSLSHWFGQNEKNLRQIAGAVERASSSECPAMLTVRGLDALLSVSRGSAVWSVTTRFEATAASILADPGRTWVPILIVNGTEVPPSVFAHLPIVHVTRR